MATKLPEIISVERPKEPRKRIRSRKKRLEASELVSRRGVIFLSHIPHGFFEEEMREYFAQFGDVTRLNLQRSLKSGKSKGFAFVEFEFEEVARIVAETMNNYMMFNRVLKCELVPQHKVKTWMFRPLSMRLVFKNKRLAREQVNMRRTVSEVSQLNHQRYKKINKTQEKLKKMGIDFKYEGIPKSVKKTPIRKKKLQESVKAEKTESDSVESKYGLVLHGRSLARRIEMKEMSEGFMMARKKIKKPKRLTGKNIVNVKRTERLKKMGTKKDTKGKKKDAKGKKKETKKGKKKTRTKTNG